jgi:hypothetical protein
MNPHAKNRIVIRPEELAPAPSPRAAEPVIAVAKGFWLQPMALVAAALGALALVAGVTIWLLSRQAIAEPPSGKQLAIQAMERVLHDDKLLMNQALQGVEPDAPPSRVVWALRGYCARAERQDFSLCPADFVVAYRQHIRAWSDMSIAVGQLPDGFLHGVFLGAFNALARRELDGGMGRLEGRLNDAHQRVRTTYEEVERTAARYGAAIRN